MKWSLGKKLLENRATLGNHEGWTRDRLTDYQSKRLHALRRYAYSHSPFMRKFHAGLEERPLDELPVLTKQLLMDRFDEFVTDRAVRLADARKYLERRDATSLFLDRYHICTTSGTSGQPGIFLYDENEWAWVLASYARANGWTGVPSGLFHRLRLAIVGSPKSWHQSKAVVDSLQSNWVRTLSLSATDPIEKITRELTRWQPRLLITYSAMAGELAEAQLAGEMNISPEAIMCVAETLTRETRKLVERAFGSTPFENYAATETGCIAAESRHHNGLHLFDDLLVTEIVNKENEPVLPGELGDKLLVSVLFSRTVPLIRYEIDDSLMLAGDDETCALPFRRLKRIGGRIAETLHIPRQDGRMAILHAVDFEDSIGETDVRCWQVFCDESGLQVHLLSPVAPELVRKVDANMRNLLNNKGLEGLAFFIKEVSVISRTPSGKMILIRDLRK